MKITKEINRNSWITLFTQGTIAICGLISGTILARTLGPAGRGEFVAIVLWSSILFFVSEMGFGFAFAYYSGKSPEKLAELFSWAIVFSVLPGLIFALLGWLLLPYLLPLSGTSLVCLKYSMGSIPFLLAAYHFGYLLLGANHILYHNLVRLASSLFYAAGIAVIALWIGGSLKGYTAVYIFAQVAAAFLGFALLAVGCHLRPAFKLHLRLLREIATYGFKAYASSLAYQTNLRLDQMLMVSMVSSAQLGLYAVAAAFAAILTPFFTTMATLVLPKVTHAKTINDGVKISFKYLKTGLLIGGPGTIAMIYLAPLAIKLIFGADFEPASRFARVLLVAYLFSGIGMVLSNSLRGIGAPGRAAIIDFVGMVSMIGLLLVFLPGYEAMGAAFAVLAVYLLVVILQTTSLLSKKISKIQRQDLICEENNYDNGKYTADVS